MVLPNASIPPYAQQLMLPKIVARPANTASEGTTEILKNHMAGCKQLHFHRQLQPAVTVTQQVTPTAQINHIRTEMSCLHHQERPGPSGLQNQNIPDVQFLYEDTKKGLQRGDDRTSMVKYIESKENPTEESHKFWYKLHNYYHYYEKLCFTRKQKKFNLCRKCAAETEDTVFFHKYSQEYKVQLKCY